jgi:hypothetical protein
MLKVAHNVGQALDSIPESTFNYRPTAAHMTMWMRREASPRRGSTATR